MYEKGVFYYLRVLQMKILSTFARNRKIMGQEFVDSCRRGLRIASK